MRRLLVLLLILAAAPAAAESARKGLRGLQAPEAERLLPAPAPLPMSPIPTLAPASPAVRDPSGEPARCRLRCAQDYYQCLSADEFDRCVPSWNQCRTACDGPSFSVGRVGRP